MLTITFTQEELTTLVQALDAAIKATGLQGAKAILPLVAKMEQAAQAQPPKPVNTEILDG